MVEQAPPPPSPMPSSVVAAAVLARPVSIVCSGASLGLPGGTAVFADDNVQRILAGENRIDVLVIGQGSSRRVCCGS